MADSPYVAYWKQSYQISSQYHLKGYSRAAENTGFYCPELEMAFDAGIQMNDVPAFICLTHLHNDHMCSLNKMLINNPKNPIIFIPNSDKFCELLESTLRFIYISSKYIHPNSAKGLDPLTKYSYRLVKLGVGESYMFKKTANSEYYVEGLPSDHGVESISFGIYEQRKRCKAEFKNLEPIQYINMRRGGIDFMETYRNHILCYMSDTMYTAFEKPLSNLIFQYPVIVVECTFLEPDDLPLAKKKRHMHWQQIEKLMADHPECKFILTHFSKRYLWCEIKCFFDSVHKAKPLHNLVVWLHTGLIIY